jgi:hypothetical protein
MVAFAVGHRIRIEALTIFNERTASPKEVFKEIGGSFGNVGHHVKLLFDAGCIELVRMVPRGGSYEHFYRAVRRPELSDEEWQALSHEDRREIVAIILRNLFAEGLASLRADKMHTDDDLRLSWKAVNLDAEGRRELAAEQAEWLSRVNEIEARACARMVASGETGTSTVAAVLGFVRSRNGQPTGDRSWPTSDS